MLPSQCTTHEEIEVTYLAANRNFDHFSVNILFLSDSKLGFWYRIIEGHTRLQSRYQFGCLESKKLFSVFHVDNFSIQVYIKNWLHNVVFPYRLWNYVVYYCRLLSTGIVVVFSIQRIILNECKWTCISVKTCVWFLFLVFV